MPLCGQLNRYQEARVTATKADYEKALRNYQKYMDEVTSDQRDRAALK